ncbi:hypothetical protein TCON_1364 [Astathelohania contejeani]|uniref:Uncharacterized protein n=1 Tax=Astathelohania contejeani TaxID=164912 RepID=A0ABQ7HZ74_9MICR|nr:hypothetical protein TCON_1364 [Thelohania contejeani]
MEIKRDLIKDTSNQIETIIDAIVKILESIKISSNDEYNEIKNLVIAKGKIIEISNSIFTIYRNLIKLKYLDNEKDIPKDAAGFDIKYELNKAINSIYLTIDDDTTIKPQDDK